MFSIFISTSVLRVILLFGLGHYNGFVKSNFIRWVLFEYISFLTDVPNIFYLYYTHYICFKEVKLEKAQSYESERMIESSYKLTDNLSSSNTTTKKSIVELVNEIDIDFETEYSKYYSKLQEVESLKLSCSSIINCD